jgi:hypothetical protein
VEGGNAKRSGLGNDKAERIARGAKILEFVNGNAKCGNIQGMGCELRVAGNRALRAKAMREELTGVPPEVGKAFLELSAFLPPTSNLQPPTTEG